MNVLDQYQILSDINYINTNNLKLYRLLESKNVNCYIIIESIKKIDLYDFLTQILVFKKFTESQLNVKLFISDYTKSNNEYTKCIKYLFGLFNIRNIEIVSLIDDIDLNSYFTLFNKLTEQIDINDIESKKNISQFLDPIKMMAKILSLNADIVSLGIDRYNIEKLFNKLDIQIPILISNKVPLTNQSLYILDSPSDLKKKILDLYFPLGIVDNIIFLYYENILFKINEKVVIERNEKYGGNLEYNNARKFRDDYISYKIHPLDIKKSLIKYLEYILEPIRENSLILDKQMIK